jgi:primosomal protein N'
VPHDQREKFKPRIYNAAQLIVVETHLKRVTVLEQAGLLPPTWREAIAFDLSACDHSHQALVEVDGEYGYWGVMICTACGVVVQKECPHVRCDWLLDGRVLRCGQCGVDAT